MVFLLAPKVGHRGSDRLVAKGYSRDVSHAEVLQGLDGVGRYVVQHLGSKLVKRPEEASRPDTDTALQVEEVSLAQNTSTRVTQWQVPEIVWGVVRGEGLEPSTNGL